jgi:hypothetical protein
MGFIRLGIVKDKVKIISLIHYSFVLVLNHVETISSTKDNAVSYSSSTIRPNQSDSNRLSNNGISSTRRSISDNILQSHNQFELTDENDHVIPKRRQSRATSSNTKVK